MKMQKALVKTVGFAALLAVQASWVAEAAAQQPPPIQGVTGTIATETSIDETTDAGHGILGKVKRVLHLNGRSPVPSGDAAAEEALGGLKKGTRVVVSDSTKSVKEVAGSVVALNLADRTISVKLSDDSIQTLRLFDEAAADAEAAGDAGANVIVYYRNESGQRLAKHFRRVS
jgi:hypothetical protein